jgi:protein kinase-like protein
MGEVPTKPGRGGAGVPIRNALEDTMRAEPTLEPEPATSATTSIPSADRYRLGAELGRGGMGRVVEAFDLQLGRTVALKEVLPRGGAGVARRFIREVQLTARLEHPSIIPLYDSGTTVDGRAFYVMRRVSGRPLDQLMAQAADLGQRLTLLPALLAGIDAVAHAHRRGVIHRDLKPANILVGELGETVVIDWGLAKVIGEDDDKPGTLIAQASDSLRTQMGSVFGTPGFMAPEQARGEELDPRGDVYALGAILYQLLAGAPPHSGTSATEVIARTGSREVTPVNVVAPGAPADLVAIVGKALAFDAAGRYPDASALGADVRRFLAGQLVAAHHYTRRQHVARFARRHRAPLSVAALAMVAVAVLAWLGVHRILQERDRADRETRGAVAGRADAQRALAVAQHRADQLLVSEARGLVDRNPTHAAAVLKSVTESSDRLPEARAVAQAAVVRGAAWTMQLTDDLTVLAELSPDARFLLQVTRDGMVRVWDLDRRRLVIARPYAPDVRALWAGKRVLVTTTTRHAPELLDPFAGTSQLVGVGSIAWAVATARGDRVAYLDDQHAAHLLDVATRTARPLWPEHRPHEIQIAADGSWIALADKTTVAVLDATGRELTTHRGAPSRLFVSRFDQVGFAAGDKVSVCALLPQPVWTELDLAPYAPGLPLDFAFRGRELDIYVTTGKIVAWNGKRLWERLAIDGFNFHMFEGDRDLLIIPGNDGQLHFLNDLVTGALHLPVSLTYAKIYAQPGAPRIVALGKGLLVGFELADSLPELLPSSAGAQAVFVDDDTLLLWSIQGGTWQWYDVRTRIATPFEYDPHGLPEIIDVDPRDGRVLVRETAQDSALYQLRKNTREHRVLVHGTRTWGHLLPGSALLFGVGDGRVFSVADTRHAGDPGAVVPHEVVKLDGFAENAVAIGATTYAAVSSSGELARGDLVTGALARTHVSPGTTGVIAADARGRVLVAQDNRLLVWDRDVVELARLDKRILQITPLDGAALLELSDHAMVRTALVPGAPVTLVLAPSDKSPLVSGDGHLIIGQSVNDQVIAVETSPQATWELPSYYRSRELVTISPSTRRFVQAGYAQLALWTLPLAGPELATWLDERTNAVTDDNHALAWPWQLARHP